MTEDGWLVISLSMLSRVMSIIAKGDSHCQGRRPVSVNTDHAVSIDRLTEDGIATCDLLPMSIVTSVLLLMDDGDG